MADQSATWALNLNADQLKGEAVSAMQALKRLEDGISGDKKRLRELNGAMKDIAKSSRVDMVHFQQLKNSAKALEAKIGDNTGAFLKLGGTFGSSKRSAEQATGSFAKMARELAKTGGPVGSLAGRLAGFTELLGSSRLALIALGVGAVGAAVGVGIAAHRLYELAIASAEARRHELLQLEGVTSLKDGWKTAAASAGLLQASIDAVSASSAASREEVGGYAKALWTAGLRGMALSNALKATATTAAAQGASAATAFVAVAAATYAAGGSVQKLAETVDTQLGGIANKHLIDSAVLAEKLHDNVAGLFASVNIEGLGQAKKAFVDLFDSSTTSGRTLARVLQPISQWLVDIAERFTNGLVNAIMTTITWELKLETAWYNFETALLGIAISVRDTMLDAWDAIKDQWEIGIAALGTALYAAAPAMWGLVEAAWAAVPALLSAAIEFGGMALAAGPEAIAALASGATALWGMAAGAGAAALSMLAVAAPFIAVAAAVLGVTLAIESLWDNWDELLAIDYGELGSNMIAGLVGGIKDAAGAALDAIKNLGTAIWGTFKSALGIHSPSRVFASLGLQIPRGIEAGIAAGQPALDRSVAGMIDSTTPTRPGFSVVAPSLTAANGGSVAPASGNSATNVTNYVTLTFDIASDSPQQAGENVRDQVISVFQTLGRQMAVT